MKEYYQYPNSIIDKEDYYISYNDYDTDIYGSDTTALVIGQMIHFYILNGDHRKNYNSLNTFEECMNYFKENISMINKYSEKP